MNQETKQMQTPIFLYKSLCLTCEMQTNLFKLQDLNVVIEIIACLQILIGKKCILSFRKNDPAQVGTEDGSVTRYPSPAQGAASHVLSVPVRRLNVFSSLNCSDWDSTAALASGNPPEIDLLV